MNDKVKIMSEENITKALFKLGMPMVISMLVMALYNVVDTYFVSGLGKQAVAAVSVAFPISLIFSGIGLTFVAGAGSYIVNVFKCCYRLDSRSAFTSVLN